jgi:hypothetical protein
MDNPQQAPQAAQPSLKYGQMTGRQKAVFILKLAVSILSFGFIFPGLTNSD